MLTSEVNLVFKPGAHLLLFFLCWPAGATALVDSFPLLLLLLHPAAAVGISDTAGLPCSSQHQQWQLLQLQLRMQQQVPLSRGTTLVTQTGSACASPAPLALGHAGDDHAL